MFTFKVKPDGKKSFEVTATTRDVIQWEKTSKKNIAQFPDGLPMQHIYKIAHLSAARQGKFSGEYQEFEDTCDLDILEDDKGEGDPFQKAA